MSSLYSLPVLALYSQTTFSLGGPLDNIGSLNLTFQFISALCTNRFSIQIGLKYRREIFSLLRTINYFQSISIAGHLKPSLSLCSSEDRERTYFLPTFIPYYYNSLNINHSLNLIISRERLWKDISEGLSRINIWTVMGVFSLQ